MENQTQLNQKQLHWYHDPLWIRFIPSVSSAIIIGIFAAGIGTLWQHSNWKKQQKISADAVLAKELFNKRAEIFRKAIFLTKAREQNIWSFRTAKMEGEKEKMDKYWEKDQQLVCECDSMIGEVVIYFDKYGGEMVKNYREGFKMFHDLMYSLGQAKTIEVLLPEETITERNKEAIKTVNKNAKFYSHYLLGVPLESS